MRQILTGTAMVLGTIALIWASGARAAPPPAGMLLSFKNPMIVCTKAEYLKDLVAAQRTGKDEFTKKAQELLGDPTKCIAAQVSNVVTGDSEDLGTVKWDETSPQEHLWSIHFGDAKSEHYGLYEEVEASQVEAPKS